MPRAQLKRKAPEDAASYMLNKHVIKYRFCANCGINPYGEGVDSKGNAMAAVNMSCIEGLDLKSIPIHEFNGRDK